MTARRFFSVVTTAGMLLGALSAPALAEETGAMSSAADVQTTIRIERCDRFANGDDYERCVRLIRRLPSRSGASSSASSRASMADDGTFDWKLQNILQRLEAKIGIAVKFSSTLAKRFCSDRTLNSDATVGECLLRMKTDLKTRVDQLIDNAFRSGATN